jgi:putative Mn2+ efflux pump MntP
MEVTCCFDITRGVCMFFYSLLLIALALSLDAFGVALSIGLNKGVNFKSKMIFCFSFGFFQFFFSFIGTYLGIYFTKYITTMPNIAGGLVILIVGLLMIKEGMDERGVCLQFKPSMYILLGVSVSIDALIVGFTAFNHISSFATVILYTLFIGVVTFIICLLAFIISIYLNRIEIIARYANYIGGIMLIALGFKMIFLG